MARATTKSTVSKARKLRREMTFPEVLLWRILRAKPGGVKFCRQHPVGRYVLDFYAPDAKLGIEIDGIAHDMGDMPQRDEERDQWLVGQGIHTLRISAKEVLADPEVVADNIVLHCEGIN